MKQELLEKCQLFVENKNVMDKSFVWDSAYIMPLCAILHTEKNMQINVDKMKECKKLLKEKVGMFSDLRSYGELVLISKMAMNDNPDQYLQKMLSAYELLKKNKLSGSSYACVVAMLLVEHIDVSEWETILQKARDIYAGMKKNHPFLTGMEDVSFAVMMAMSDLSQESILKDAEACYKLLSKTFSASDGTQTLSHLLSMNTQDSESKCANVLELHQAFKAKKKQFSNSSIVMYGILNMMDADKETLLEEIIEVDEYLKGQKGFGFWGIDTHQRLMYATMLVMDQYDVKSTQIQVSMVSSVIGTIIAEYMAILAVTVAVTATTVANN